MSNEARKYIEGQLRPGYRFGDATSTGTFPLLDPKGDPVRLPNGQPVVANLSASGWHIRRRTLKNLRDAGALMPPRTRTHSHDEEKYKPVKVRPADVKGPIVLAKEILRDTNASPRERRMAKSYLDAVETVEKLRELSQKLADRIYELQKQLDE